MLIITIFKQSNNAYTKEFLMQKDKTNEKQGLTPNEKLMAKLGIKLDQVQPKAVTKSTVSVISNNSDQLKANLKESTRKVNADLGKMITFNTIKREGSLKDENGKLAKDENGKTIPRYVKATMSGMFVIDKTEDGFFQVTKGIHYTESHLVTEFTEIT